MAASHFNMFIMFYKNDKKLYSYHRLISAENIHALSLPVFLSSLSINYFFQHVCRLLHWILESIIIKLSRFRNTHPFYQHINSQMLHKTWSVLHLFYALLLCNYRLIVQLVAQNSSLWLYDHTQKCNLCKNICFICPFAIRNTKYQENMF